MHTQLTGFTAQISAGIGLGKVFLLALKAIGGGANPVEDTQRVYFPSPTNPDAAYLLQEFVRTYAPEYPLTIWAELEVADPSFRPARSAWTSDDADKRFAEKTSTTPGIRAGSEFYVQDFDEWARFLDDWLATIQKRERRAHDLQEERLEQNRAEVVDLLNDLVLDEFDLQVLCRKLADDLEFGRDPLSYHLGHALAHTALALKHWKERNTKPCQD